ncbi:enoyl-CoA hydratase [Gordonia terrae]|uniref:Enoyl-CoA hydratase n=1 Tax=Gordonia terrae TaxID=2055 RepID=A0A2I1R140_9ACTN|nr:enoyl-CoA hydratase-related protein [Gordonia terrae]PKZ62856.1 enoyl-CoA hydratase [Gordonia terrae]
MSDIPIEPLVLKEQRGAVLVLTFNRPDRLNAWTDALEDEYFSALDAAEQDPTVRAVVVTGAGRGFCAGADLRRLQLASESRQTESETPRPRPRHRPLSLQKPLIGAVNGAAAGLGLIQALYCDIRFIVPEAKITTAFAQRGLIAEYGIAWLLPRILGTGRALDLLFSSRMLTGTEAHAIGLAEFLVDDPDELLDRAISYATALASTCSPKSLQVIKSQVYQALQTDLASALLRADEEKAESFRSDDFAEGVSSYLERRPPSFAPLLPPR